MDRIAGRRLGGRATTAAALLLALLMAACGGKGPTEDAPDGGGGSADVSATWTLAGQTRESTGTGRARAQLRVANAGPGTATNVTPAYQVSGLNFFVSSIGCSAEGGAVCPGQPASTVPVLPPGGVLVYTVDVIATGALTAPVSITGSFTAVNDLTSADNQATVSVPFNGVDLAVTAAAPASPAGGSSVPFTLTVTNGGSAAARDVAITASLGNGLTLGSMTCAAQGGAVCPASTGLAMTAPSVPAGGALVFTATAAVGANPPGVLWASAWAAAAGDTTIANNAATAAASRSGTTVPSFLSLDSDPSEFISAGRPYDYTSANTTLTVTAVDNRLHLEVAGAEQWTADFLIPGSGTTLEAGSWSGLTRYPLQTAGRGALDFRGEGRGCNTLTGSFDIESVTYTAGTLSSVTLAFVQYCEGQSRALRGRLRWSAP